MAFKEVNVNNLNINPFESIGKDWMLITSGDKEKFNTMTASWGGLGVLWNKNVTFSFVRPQRYTFEFLEKNDLYTLSFFNNNYRKALTLCGKVSGRDIDKVKESKLTPKFDNGFTYFEQARLVLACKKIYTQFIDPNHFIDDKIESNYENKDYHNMYVGEIISCLVNEDNE